MVSEVHGKIDYINSPRTSCKIESVKPKKPRQPVLLHILRLFQKLFESSHILCAFTKINKSLY